MPSIRTETETVIKRILPYLKRRGYDPEKDLDFETAFSMTDRYSKGYVDILVTCGKPKPLFLVEAKRSSKRLTDKDRKQALSYGAASKVPFVVVTNGYDVQAFNTATGEAILWDGQLTQKIPRGDQLPKVISYLKAHPQAAVVPLSNDTSLPFRPGLPLKQLNAMFSRCHSAIRNIEKNEEHSFADFSKILFLKLLEEKADRSEFTLPYSYRFHELAQKPESEADQVKNALLSMLDDIRRRPGYGEVLADPPYLKKPQTFRMLVRELAAVSFDDSGLDTKGAAFEYFVRATLKGKRLGQYFTPRPLVELMCKLAKHDRVLDAIRAGTSVKVLDPACGTGGFLVYLLKEGLDQLEQLVADRKIAPATYDDLKKKLMAEVFHGADANEGVASAAKMNMIVAGDGHTNIRAEDSLKATASTWSLTSADYDFILTNPPFGTSESSSLNEADLRSYPLASPPKGQLLFLQKMVMATKPKGTICTVIDEGVLNTDIAAPVRKWLLENARILAVVRLPEDTFKPNKINVRTSVLLMEKRDAPDPDLAEKYNVVYVDVDSLGYIGSGESIRGFDFEKLLREADAKWLTTKPGHARSGYRWSSFAIPSGEIHSDEGNRLDLKYWEPGLRKQLSQLKRGGGCELRSINTIATARGKSPRSDLYVGPDDGYAVVLKAGTSISKYGELMLDDSDYIEKAVYDEMPEEPKVQKGDVLLASTGDGTLGKACVYDAKLPAVADGHVTIVRVDQSKIDPAYLSDYLRTGLGHDQIMRLYSGSTGLIELTPGHVDQILVHVPTDLSEQRRLSRALRKAEKDYVGGVARASKKLDEAYESFRNSD